MFKRNKKDGEPILENVSSFKLDIAKIKIKSRIRKEMGNLSELKESISKYGQINPVLIDEKYRLIAGERRYRAMKELKLKEIEVKILKNVDDYDRYVLEIEENSTRKDFTTSEYMRALEKKNLLRIKKVSFWQYVKKVLMNFFKKLFRRKEK